MSKGFHGQPVGVITETYIKALEAENERLREGGCRFNCRTQRDMFIAGFTWAVRSGFLPDFCLCAPEDAYKAWKREQEKSDA